jgi:simple sugar transport system substrate-binding protein
MTEKSDKMSRRQALGVVGGLVVGGVVGAAGGYYAGQASVSPTMPGTASTVTQTLMGTVTASAETSAPKYKFAMVSHVTAVSFWVPAKNAVEDAAKAFNVKVDWLGPEGMDVPKQAEILAAAVASDYDGIGVTLVDPTAFNESVQAALAKGIPVVSFNADSPDSGRMAYVGQVDTPTGYMMGQRIAKLVPKGGKLALWIVDPGHVSLEGRLAGTKQALDELGIKYDVQAGAGGGKMAENEALVEAYVRAHPDVVGLFCVDAEITEGIGSVIDRLGLKGKVVGGGFDLTPRTLDFISKGDLDFTIDQQPYDQGFFTIVNLFLYVESGKLLRPCEINTGVGVVTKDNVALYLQTNRYT